MIDVLLFEIFPLVVKYIHTLSIRRSRCIDVDKEDEQWLTQNRGKMRPIVNA